MSITLGELRNKALTFKRKRDWEQFHDPKNLAEAISIGSPELLHSLANVLSTSKVHNLVSAMQFMDLYGFSLIPEFHSTPAELAKAKSFYGDYQKRKGSLKYKEEFELAIKLQKK